MNDRPREYDPRLEAPHGVRPDPLVYDPLNPVPPAPKSSARAGLVLLAMVAALFVIGFIAFSGPGVDEDPTASIPAQPGTQEQILPGNAEPIAPNPGVAPAPQETAPAPSE